MLELLHNPIFLVFAFLTLSAVVGTLANSWTKVRRAEIEAALKHDMIERGMSAEDIQKVLEASARGKRQEPCEPHPDTAAHVPQAQH